MVVNPILATLLDQRCDVFRSVETRSGGLTKKNLASVSTGVAVHVQSKPQRERLQLRDVEYGQEESGDYWAFLHSTQDVALGDYFALRTGPWAGKGFYLRGWVDNTDVAGIEHICGTLDFTPLSTGDVV
jgi:hypothetical protein